jgi:hypothetical protein
MNKPDRYLEDLQRRRAQATAESPTPESPPDAGATDEGREGEAGSITLSETLRALQHWKRRTWR